MVRTRARSLRGRFLLLVVVCASLPLVGARGDDAPTASAWLELTGSARVEAGRNGPILRTEGIGIGVLRAEAQADCRVDFRFRRDGSGVAVVLLALSTDRSPRSAYSVQLRDDAIVLAREQDGRILQLASGGPPLGAGTWYDVTVTRSGTELRVDVGGVLRVGADDPRPLPPGRVALGSWIGGGFAFANVRVEEITAPAATPEAERFRVGTGIESARGDWKLSKGAVLKGLRAERLHVPAGGRAVWDVRPSASSSFACRFRGGAVLRVGRMGGRAADGEVWLGVSPQGVQLTLVKGGDEQVLREAPAPPGGEAWHDLTVHTDRGWIRAEVDRVPVIETKVPGLIAAETIEFRARTSDAAFADVRFVPWKLARVGAIRELLQRKTAPTLRPNNPQATLRPLPQGPRVVPLRSMRYAHPGQWKKAGTRIDPGPLPPNYVHTWVLDVAGIESLDFRPYSANTIQLDAADRLSFFDLDGLLQKPPKPLAVITPSSKASALRIPLSKAKSLSVRGQTYRRIFLQLETSPALKPRRFKLEALLNEAPNDGDEEILVLGDDLDPTAPYIYPAVDPNGVKLPGIPSPFQSGPDSGFNNYPPTLEEDGWYLLGRNLTDPSKLFYSLVYYNEGLSDLRIFLFNLDLPTNVTGSTLTLSLVAWLSKQAPSGKTYFTGQPLEGAFFPLHANPNKWSSATVPLPPWNRRSWVCVEIPIAYPMGANVPVDLAVAASQAPGLYRSLYEEPLPKGQRTVALKLQVGSYDLGTLQGDWYGKAIGEAVQELGSDSQGGGLISMDLLKAAAKTGGDVYSGGKKIYDGIKAYRKKNGGGQGDMGKKILSLGSSVFGGAFGMASAAYSFIDGIFGSPDPLRFSIELELSGKLSGTVRVNHTQGPFWMCYLPGRFSIEEAYPRGLDAGGDALGKSVPIYDRPVGLFGYAYNPGDLHFRMLRWDKPKSASGLSPVFVLPGSPSPDLQASPTATKQALPLVERFLPVVYNEYAEIVLAKPVIQNVETYKATPKSEGWTNLAPNMQPPPLWTKRYRWLGNHAWVANVTPEAGDPDFPFAIKELIAPGLSEMSIVAYLGPVPTALPLDVTGKMVAVLDMPKGLRMQVEPRTGYAPCTYRDFPTKEQRDFKVMQWYGAVISDMIAVEPYTPRPFQPDDPFPVQNVEFRWAQKYFYYARSRQRGDGSVPSLTTTAYFHAPVTMDLGRIASVRRVAPELIVHEIPSALLR